MIICCKLYKNITIYINYNTPFEVPGTPGGPDDPDAPGTPIGPKIQQIL